MADARRLDRRSGRSMRVAASGLREVTSVYEVKIRAGGEVGHGSCGSGWNLEQLGVVGRRCELGHSFELHVAMLELTLAETYLRARGNTYLDDLPALRFHPCCYYRADETAPVETWPAMLAAVTDFDGTITGVHRTWLARDGGVKAPIATPRRAMGRLLGNGVQFGGAQDVVAVGEGNETMPDVARLPVGAAAEH